MSENKVRAVRYEVQEVGKHIKGSKKRFLWVVTIGERVYNFVLDDSVVSGKSKLSINGKVFHEIEQASLRRCKYNHSFIIDGCLFNLIEMEDNYEMRINNNLFSHLLAQQMKWSSFTDHKVDETSFDLDQKFKQAENKKITMNIPGLATSMKKKKGPSVQSDNWGTFAGGVSEFPNFFGSTETKKQTAVIPKQESNKVSSEVKQIGEAIKQQCNQIPQPVKCQPNTLNTEEFSTLQNLFKTINASGAYVEKVTESTPTYEVNEIPVIPEINLMQFNTMQNLFQTTNPQINEVKPKKIETKFDDFSFTANQPKRQVNETKFDCFNTMQNLFNTNATKIENPLILPQPQLFKQQEAKKIDFSDFSNIQNMFPSNQQSQQQFNFEKKAPPQPNFKNTVQKQLQISTNNLCLNDQKPEAKINISTIDPTKIDFSDFNTMQKLFATNFIQPTEQVLSTTKSNIVTQSQQVPKIQQKNASSNDFNTMQNLFQTGIQKKQNQFWQF